jgi:hypothetical protein
MAVDIHWLSRWLIRFSFLVRSDLFATLEISHFLCQGRWKNFHRGYIVAELQNVQYVDGRYRALVSSNLRGFGLLGFSIVTPKRWMV